MIIFFGPAGSGKSLQGQILAAREGWRWLSAGQLLRDTHNPELTAIMHKGGLIEPTIVNNIVRDALLKASDIKKVVLDGFPRMIEQATWLVDSQPEHGRSISAVIVLEVDKDVLLKRLSLRGRADDQIDAIDNRLDIYKQETDPILDYLKSQGIKIIYLNGSGSVGEIHDNIMKKLGETGIL